MLFDREKGPEPDRGPSANKPAREQIIEFVKNTLGCKCPDEVFRHIEYEKNVQLRESIHIHAKINIGGRLLIYVMDAPDPGLNSMEYIVNAGRNERDARGFNRFRLVVKCDDVTAAGQSLLKPFNDLKGSDDKIHLHMVKREDILL